jgi:hypothetical protein
LDFESQSSYAVTVRATDSGGLSHDQTVVITVTDVNDAPSFTSTAVLASAEDTTYSYGITTSDPDAGAGLTITAPTLPAWLTLSDNGDGTATLSGTPTNAEVGAYAVSLQVSDGSLQDTQSFMITVANTNDAPEIITHGGASSVMINAAENESVVTMVVASDVDLNDMVLYAITGGADAAQFEIDSVTGVLSFTSPKVFSNPSDSDLDGRYEVVVTASDLNGSVAIQTITVRVTEVTELSAALPIEETIFQPQAVPELVSAIPAGEFIAENQAEETRTASAPSEVAEFQPLEQSESTGLTFPDEPLSVEFPVQATTPIQVSVSSTVARPEISLEPETRLWELLRTWVSGLTERENSLQVELDKERFLDGLASAIQDYDKRSDVEASKGKLSAELATGLVLTLTAGFVSWMLQAGSMIASLLTSLPAWRQLDLLPILSAHEDKDVADAPDETDEDNEYRQNQHAEDSVDSLLRKTG